MRKGRTLELEIIKNVRERVPLVHCITNYVTVNDVANILLACGASPIMADDAREVEDITQHCSALVINIGTLNARTVEAMILAGRRANEMGHPVILDPVGAGASGFRSETVFRLLKEVRFSVIRGNISEMRTVYEGIASASGVDAKASDAVTKENLPKAIDFVQKLSARTGAVIAVTGEIDIVADAREAYLVYNGHAMLSKVTGTGCMLSGLLGAYVAANPGHPMDAVLWALATMGYAGELAAAKTQRENAGIGSFRVYLIDAVGQMTDEKLKVGVKVEQR